MEKAEKGLADAQEGEFILNESGTAVSTDPVEGLDIPVEGQRDLKDKKTEQPAREAEQ